MLSEEKAKKIVWGGLYTCEERLHSGALHTHYGNGDQRYRYWVPCYRAENEYHPAGYFMINLYQVESIYGGYEKILDRFVNKFRTNGSGAVSATGNYYYNAAAVLDDSTFNLFKLEYDLKDYKPISARDIAKYRSEDVIEDIKLYREHNYPNGICLVKKDATEDIWLRTNYEIDRFFDYKDWADHMSAHSEEEIQAFIRTRDQLLASGRPFNVELMDLAIEKAKLIAEIAENYRGRMHEINLAMHKASQIERP